MVADQQRRLHRARRNLVGLDEKSAQNDCQHEGNRNRLCPLAELGSARLSCAILILHRQVARRGFTEIGGLRHDEAYSPTLSRARNASWGISTLPTCFIRFLPSFCFSSSLRFRVMSPP